MQGDALEWEGERGDKRDFMEDASNSNSDFSYIYTNIV